MKHSLDLTNPWITKYYKSQETDQELKTCESDAIDESQQRRDMYKFWLADEDLSNKILPKEKESLLETFG